MYKLPMMIAAGLVLGAPLAFAASQLPNPADLTTQHCSYLETQYPTKDATSYSAAARQAAEEKALSLCREDRHKNGGVNVGAANVERSKPAALLLVRP